MFKAIDYCQLIYLRTLEICLKIHELDLAHFLTAPELVWQAALKKIKVKLDLLTDIEMLLMVEKSTRSCLGATQLKNKINLLEKNEIDIDTLKI